MSTDLIPIGQASKILGVSIQTLRNWEKTGKLLPDFISVGRTRRYSRRRLLSIAGLTNQETKEDQKTTIAYARVSTIE
jgi:putative resolvase